MGVWGPSFSGLVLCVGQIPNIYYILLVAQLHGIIYSSATVMGPLSEISDLIKVFSFLLEVLVNSSQVKFLPDLVTDE